MFQTPLCIRGGDPITSTLDDQNALPGILREHERLLLQFTASQSHPPKHTIINNSSLVVHGHTTFVGQQGNGIWHTTRSQTLSEEDEQPRVPKPSQTTSVLPKISPAPVHAETRPSTNLRKNATVSNASRNALATTTSSGEVSKTTPQPTSQSSLSRPLTLPLHVHESQIPMSSSEYRTSPSLSGSESPSPSSSPAPRNNSRAPRRSGRAKNQPVTYNVRRLLGLEVEVSDDPQDASIGPHGGVRLQDTQSAPKAPPSTKSQLSNLQKLLWDREIHGRGRRNQIHMAVSSDLHTWKSWKGASNDVLNLAWSPDSTKFALGAATQPDEYNRNKNLLVGDLAQHKLYELPDHWIPRPTQISGVDDRLFTTVSGVQWVGQNLYTASYDQTVKIWDVGDKERPRCRQTLKHESEVVTISLSEHQPNLVATGSRSFGIWRLQEDEDPHYTLLPVIRTSRQKSNIDLTPTNLVWGNTAHTRNLLIGGMAERSQDDYQVPLCGHLGLWRVDPASVTPLKVTPDSQNIFDIKWHPHLPRFASATTYSPSMGLPSGTRSVLSIYDLSSDRFLTTHQLPCPAQDINELTFCPMDSTYLTASCTDGNTYVWDVRNPGAIVHRLLHGESLQPLNHEYPRELTDSGVNVALWGTTIDQFYTGASDGCLKQWDIRRAPEDTLVRTTVSLGEGIVSGSFSPDKSHLLLGDHGGGIHVLSSGPYSDPDNHEFEEVGPAGAANVKTPDPLEHPPEEVDTPDPESGVELAKALIASGQLDMHPIYGPVQGASYQGPFASWARGIDPSDGLDKLRLAPLLAEYQIRQFDGPPLQDRAGLDEDSLRVVQQHFNLAHARSRLPPTQARRDHKRKRESSTFSSSSMVSKPKKKKKKKKRLPVITNVSNGVIDLTADSPEPEEHPPS